MIESGRKTAGFREVGRPLAGEIRAQKRGRRRSADPGHVQVRRTGSAAAGAGTDDPRTGVPRQAAIGEGPRATAEDGADRAIDARAGAGRPAAAAIEDAGAIVAGDAGVRIGARRTEAAPGADRAVDARTGAHQGDARFRACRCRRAGRRDRRRRCRDRGRGGEENRGDEGFNHGLHGSYLLFRGPPGPSTLVARHRERFNRNGP